MDAITLRVFAFAAFATTLLCLAPLPAGGTAPSDHPASHQTPRFSGSVEALSDDDMAKMRGVSWHPGCPVPLEELRLLRVSHWDFDGQIRQGDLVAHRQVAHELLDIFSEIFQARFPVASMRPVAEFGGDDDASMAANNTSAFNCRRVTGGRGYSRHAYGMAVDINPVQNPWVKGEKIRPAAGSAHLVRDASVKGLILRESPVVAAFLKRGWNWGGRWQSLKDYHHFEKKR